MAGGAVKISFTGLDKAKQRIKQIADAGQKIGRELYQEGQAILSKSVPLVPVDTGALRSTGFVTKPAYEAGSIKVTVGYGGVARGSFSKGGKMLANPFVGYAVIVHERLDVHHTVGGPKFLEIPFRAAQSGMAQRIVKNVFGVKS